MLDIRYLGVDGPVHAGFPQQCQLDDILPVPLLHLLYRQPVFPAFFLDAGQPEWLLFGRRPQVPVNVKVVAATLAQERGPRAHRVSITK